jgi:hypothetical protein
MDGVGKSQYLLITTARKHDTTPFPFSQSTCLAPWTIISVLKLYLEITAWIGVVAIGDVGDVAAIPLDSLD